MRRLMALYFILVLFLSFIRAPFFHLHEGHEHGADEPGHERLDLAFHTHVESHSSSAGHDGETTIGAQNEPEAQPQSFFQFKQETPPPPPFLVERVAFFCPAASLTLKVFEFPPRVHDPPFVHSSIPRSPPV